MKAKEMFEKLGFTKLININNGTWYSKINDDGNTLSVRFNHNEKTIQCTFSTDNESMGLPITFELYKAITQQMKELGWIE